MKTITNEIIDKFIEAGLINIKSIDHVRKLEVMRDEFNLMEKERMIQLVQGLKDYTRESHTILGYDEREASEFVDIFYNETYGGGEQ